MRALHANLGATVLSESSLVQGLTRVRLAPGISLTQRLRQYQHNPQVLYAEPNYIVHALAVPNDPDFPVQWNFQNTGQWGGTVGADIHLPQAWDITTGSSKVAVGVIDTGADYTHPDLGPNVWTSAQGFSVTTGSGAVVNCQAGSRGFNMVAQSCDPLDDEGHGTHVSGTIGALGNNGVGVAGINWQVQIIPCKFLDASGAGDVSGAIACLEWMQSLKASGVPIIATNNSWGGGFSSQALADAIAAQAAAGVLFVAAAGNEFLNNDVETVIPAGIFSSNLISVAATNNNDVFAAFSDSGAHSVHVSAPGQEVLSTFPGNSYAIGSGTSMAAPHVTGLAALLKAANPALDWRAIRNLILTGGDPIPSLSQTVTGRRLNAYGSLTCSGTTVQRRLEPTVDVMPAAIGEPVVIAAINVNCGNAGGPLQVTVQPGGQTIALSDNGQSPDQSAGDGIYTGRFTPQAVGSSTIAFPWGDKFQIEVLKSYLAGETAYNYRSIAGISLNLADDTAGTIAAPFPIHFGGASFSTLYVGSNGLISVTNKFNDFVPERIPVDYFSQLPVNPPAPALYQPVVTLLAPWWQDLSPVPNTSHNVFWEVTGSAPNRELVIEWRDVPAFACAGDLNSTIKFQVVLSESSDNIVVNYADTHFGGNCADGDLGAEAEIGLQISQTTGTEWGIGDGGYLGNESLYDGLALLWSIPAANAPPNPVPTLAAISPSTFTVGAGDTNVTLTGTNFVPSSHVELYPFAVRPTKFVSSTQLQFALRAADLAYPQYQVQVNVVTPEPGGGASNAVYYTVQTGGAQITSISPSSAPAGSFGLVLTIRGTGLQGAGDVMFDNGTSPTPWLQTTSVTPTQITAILPDYLMAAAGQVNIYLFNGNSITSNKVPFTISGAAGGIVAPPPTLSSGSSPPPALPPLQFFGWKEAAQRGSSNFKRFMRPRADLAPDGKPLPITGTESLTPDAAAVTPLAPPGLGFRPTLPADFLPTAVVAGDFNGDGHADWAVANGGSNNIWIYLGKGDGTAQLPFIVPLRGFSPVAMVAIDMNGDSKLDLVVAEADSACVAVLLGNGDGTFQSERITYVQGAPISLAAADFDGDGKPDVVVGLALSIDGSPMAFLAGDGKGNLGLPITHFGVGASETIALATADLNGDGLPDIVAVTLSVTRDGVLLASQFSNTGAAVYLNAGNGTFKLLQRFDPDYTGDQIGYFGHAVTAIALGDVNHDGCVDAVTIDHVGLADYYPGLCNGTFDTANMRTIGAGVPGAAAALSDLNGDGKLDLIVTGFHFNDNYLAGASTGDAVSILLGSGDGTFAAARIYRGEPAMYSFAVADLNGDGAPDIVTANEGSDSASVYLNNRSGAFGDPSGGYVGYLTGEIVHGTLNSPKTTFAFADMNGDGKKDLLFFEYPLLAYQATNMAVMLGDGAGHYAPPVRSDVLYTQDSIGDMAIGDFRNTGRPDVLVLNYAPSKWSLLDLRNNGDGTFQRTVSTVTGADSVGPAGMAAGDFNKDGNLDVMAISSTLSGTGVVPFLGHGDGTFTVGTVVQFGKSTTLQNPVAADVNGDGNLDLLLVENGSLYLLPGNGDGTFSAQQLLFSNVGYFATADLNGDGILDLVRIVENPRTPGLQPLEYAVYLGQPGGTFKAAGTYGPYPGLFTNQYLGASPTDPTKGAMPFLADFNGDGKLDIAAYQTSVDVVTVGNGFFETGPGNTTLSFLLGNGDGTFTPTYLSYNMERFLVPQLAVDVNADQWSDLIQFDWITSSYHVIPGTPGPAFSAALVSDPVIGAKGVLRVTLALSAVSSTTVQLVANDPGISIPSSVTIPAGSFRTDVPFNIGASFNPNHVFSITAQIGAETHTAFGTQSAQVQGLGFVSALSSSSYNVLASQSTPDYGLFIGSVNGYATEVQLQCKGLPAGASCKFGNNPIDLGSGEISVSKVAVATPSNLALGTYPFTLELSDGIVSQQLQATLVIGDFSVSAPANQNLLSSGFNLLSITVNSINGFNQEVLISCNAGFPPGLACPWEGAQLTPIGNYPTYVTTQGLTPGTYQWTITGTVGAIKRSSTVPLYVSAQAPSVSGSINPSTATVPVGSSAKFTVSLQSQNGTTGAFNFSCLSLPVGISCDFNPPQVTLAANSSSTTMLTVSVTSMPAGAVSRPQARSHQLPQYGAALLGLAFFAGISSKRRRRAIRILSVPRPLLALLILAFLLAVDSCGGGSSGGGGTTEPPPPPPPPPAQVTIFVQTAGPGISAAAVGSVTISIPQ